MKKILIAIDYNPVSEKVANEGHELAKALGAEICLLHVVTDIRFYGTEYPTFMGYHGADIPADSNFDGEIEKVAQNFLKTAAEHLGDPAVKTQLEEGDTAQCILNYAQQWKADMIVMGTHSHSALEKLMMGDVTAKVIKKTKIPVFLVPVKK